MNTEEEAASKAISDEILIVHGSGSVAHQIIGEFLSSLEGCEGYGEIAQDLRVAIFEGRPTEAALRTAIFGDAPCDPRSEYYDL